jgi:hypothetical protein
VDGGVGTGAGDEAGAGTGAGEDGGAEEDTGAGDDEGEGAAANPDGRWPPPASDTRPTTSATAATPNIT